MDGVEPIDPGQRMTGKHLSPLHDIHAESGAKFTDFGGWEMPVSFEGIRAEHRAVRESVGRFDVSHMGEIVLSGPDARSLMQRLVTGDVGRIDAGPKMLYSMVTDESGHIMDDVMICHLPDSFDGDWLFVPNAGHDAWLHDWAEQVARRFDLDVVVDNRTRDYAMLAIQGPAAPDLVGSVTDSHVTALQDLMITSDEIGGIDCLVSTSGYTGEPGYEVLCPWEAAETVWTALECQDCGLGARDTLRLEMGYLLSGNEFDYDADPRNPFETGWGDHVVDFKSPFVGRDALEAIAAAGVDEWLVGVELRKQGVPRRGYSLHVPDGEQVGTITSGTMSPTLGRGIGLGYVDRDVATPGTEVLVEIRGDRLRADIVDPPFVDR